MKAVVYSFTRRGAMLSINIGEALQKFDFEVRCLTMPKFAEEKIFLEAMDDHNKACEYAFKECQLIVFVGAVGIAVRTIAPYIKNKLVDPAVLSVDEGGNFVIPLLSGHIGGANGFAKVLAKVIKATPVVTTATDVNKLFAVDEWAARNNMIINSMKAAKDFAAALVDGQEVGLFTDYPIISALPRQIVLKDKGVIGLAITKNRNVNPFDLTVQLWPRNIYLGIGCRRGTTLESIETLVLPKLKELGIDILWLSPIYRSPLVDQGYDISDYYAIGEQFGTMEEFDELIAETKKRNMSVLMDLVVNHCSSEHEWFKKAMADPEGEYGDYFYIRESKDGQPINNARSYFGGNIWEPIPGTNKYYLHMFAKEQPDLNWENPKVRQEIYKMVNWWLDKGLAGFRIDAIINIKKNLDFPMLEPDGLDGL